MTVTPRVLINSQFAGTSASTVAFQVGTGKTVIIDKFTVTNIESTAKKVSVYLVPSGSSAGNGNLIVKEKSLNAATTADLTELQNQILGAEDSIIVVAESQSTIVMRASGREIA